MLAGNHVQNISIIFLSQRTDVLTGSRLHFFFFFFFFFSWLGEGGEGEGRRVCFGLFCFGFFFFFLYFLYISGIVYLSLDKK